MDRLRPSGYLFFVAIIGFALIGIGANAAGPGVGWHKSASHETRLSLPQAVSITGMRNLRKADSRLAVAEKEHQRRQAFSDFFPSIDLQYTAGADKYQQQILNDFLINSQTYTSQTQVEALSGTQPSRWVVRGDPASGGLAPSYPYRIDPYRSFTLSVTVTQPLFTGGKLLNDYKFASLRVDYSAIQFEVDRQDLILEVYGSYYQLLQAIKLLGVANDSVRALQAIRNVTKEFYRNSVVSKADVLAAEGQLAQALVQQTQAMTDIQQSKAKLNLLLRYPQETSLEIVEDLSYNPNPYRIPDIYATAAANRLEIRQANISSYQARAMVKSSQADLSPSVSIQAKGARLNDDWNVFDPEGTNDWMIQGVLMWSFDTFRGRESVKEKRASEARTFVAREQVVEQVMNDVKMAYLDMKSSESDINNNRKAVQFRRENFRINRANYIDQVATYTELLDAQRQLSMSEGDYIMSVIGYLTNLAVLERKIGMLR